MLITNRIAARTPCVPSEVLIRILLLPRRAPLLRFLGLATEPAVTVDFEPIFPWLGPFLLGIAAAKAASALRLLPRLALPHSPVTRLLAWPGQHSLVIYLIHQPLLIGALQAFAFLSVWLF